MAATKARRRPRAETPKLGKESWQIIGPNGELLRESPYGEGPMLALAQTLALDWDKKVKEVELTVRLQALFGPPDPLFRVVRDLDGTVTTFSIRPKD